MHPIRSISQDDYKNFPSPSDDEDSLASGPLLSSLIGVALIAAAFVAGQIVGNRDARLLRAVDTARDAMAARSCGKHATPWKSLATGAYGCLYSDAAGQTLITPTTEPAALTARR